MDDYQSLAQLATAQCPPAYEVLIEAELDDGYAEIGLYCINGDVRQHITNIPVMENLGMHRHLDAIREEMAQVSGQKWSYCTFRVLSDRTFKLDVSYDGPLPGMSMHADRNI